MSKKKRKSDDSKNNSQINISLDYDKLAEAIVKANKISAEQLAEDEKKANESAQKDWLNIIGIKEYPQNEKWIYKKWHKVKNDWATLKSLFLFKQKDAKTPRLSFELMRLGAETVYGLCELLLYLFALGLVGFAIYSKWQISSIFLSIAYGLVAVLFARIIRIAKFEIENIKDREMLNTIFSANMAFIGVILTVVTLIVQLLQGR